MNAIAWLGFELAYYSVAFQYMNHNAMGIPQVHQKKILRFAGHGHQASNKVVSPVIFWNPQSQTSKRGNKLSAPDVIARDSGIEV